MARSVLPEEIQMALNQIWESLETTNVTRACLFNLIFYTPKNHRMPYIQKLAQKIIEKFPSRVLFITTDTHAINTELNVEVSILTASQGQFDIACDYIQIDAAGAALQKVPFLVLPHLLPDLPVYLLLAEDPCEDDPLFNQLEQFAHRLIFDSETTDDLSAFAANLLYQHKRLGLDIADLNWARLEQYRQMLSTTFYSDNHLEALKRTRSIQMTYNAQKTPFFSHTKIQAVYLQAWLASQMKWEFCQCDVNDHTLTLTYRSTTGPIDVIVTGIEAPELPPGLILSIDITTNTEEHFSFKQDLSRVHQIILQHSTKEKCDLPLHYIFPKAEAGHSLVKEVCHKGTSEHFLNTLQLIEQMQAQSLC